ncbi:MULTISPECIES: glyoxalase [Actinosynnema]|uniref:glyoxalase n=1 Tax=Actinosynnema TaxID=40566 RepID=UPI0020A5FAB5|nr:glyoxalase [Actinosynnema pretiosum]MCP2092088.1 Glyoxalase-like domain-containing protein [Actinosynnema pretiosum]
MPEETVRPNETTVPLLWCTSAEETLAFWRALGFETAYEQTRPYLYLVFAWSGMALHYAKAPEHVDPESESTGGCLVMVDSVAAYHAAFTAAMRAAHGKVPSKGVPRITRFRQGSSRFTVVDPSGNSLVFIQRDEPEVEYGGSSALEGLAKVLDNARVLSEFKQDPKAAFRALNSGLRRHGDGAPAVERAVALGMLIDLAEEAGTLERVPEWGRLLTEVELTGPERERVLDAVADRELVAGWLARR